MTTHYDLLLTQTLTHSIILSSLAFSFFPLVLLASVLASPFALPSTLRIFQLFFPQSEYTSWVACLE